MAVSQRSSKTLRTWRLLSLQGHSKHFISSKAAADGAVIWAAKQAVVGRATRVSYGTIVRVRYDPLNPEHRGRKITRGIAGYDGVVGKWSEIIAEVRPIFPEWSTLVLWPLSHLGGRSERPRICPPEVYQIVQPRSKRLQ